MQLRKREFDPVHDEIFLATPNKTILTFNGRQSSDVGIVLDPLHKEVIIATAAGNAVMTFPVPEVFD